MGSSLRIALPSSAKKGSEIKVKIYYKTDKDCVALQWLEKESVIVDTCKFIMQNSAYYLMSTGRPRATNSRIYSVSANLYTLALWLHSKVSE